MVQRQYPYLDLSVREETRDFLFAKQAGFIFSEDFSMIYWANVAATQMFGFDSIEDLLMQRLTANHEIASNCQQAAEKIKRNKSYQFELSIPHKRSHRNVIFKIEKITLADKAPAYFIHENRLIGDDKHNDKGIKKLVSFLANEGNFAAVLGFQGKVLAASKGFSKLKIPKTQLSNLTYKVAKEDDRLIKRLIAVGRNKLAAGIGTIEEKPYRFLLILVPIEEEENSKPKVGKTTAKPKAKAKPKANAKPKPKSKPKIETKITTEQKKQSVVKTATKIDAKPAQKSSFETGRSIEVKSKHEVAPKPLGKTIHAEKSIVTSKQPTKNTPENKLENKPISEMSNVTPTPVAPVARKEISNAPKNIIEKNLEASTTIETPKKVFKAEVSSFNFADTKENKLTNLSKNSSPNQIIHQGKPVKFTWETDAGARFKSISSEFPDLLRINNSDILNHSWQELAEKFGFDEKGEIAGLFKGKDMWSGKSVFWPIGRTEDSADLEMAVPVDLAALPSFDKDKKFTGFKGFGIIHMENQKPIKKPIETPIKRQVEKAPEKQVKNLTQAPAQTLTPRPVQAPISAPNLKSPAPPVKPVVSKPMVNKPTETVNKPTEKPIQAPVDEPIKKIAEKAAKEVIQPKSLPEFASRQTLRDQDTDDQRKKEVLNTQEKENFAEIAKTLSQSIGVKNPNTPKTAEQESAALEESDVVVLPTPRITKLQSEAIKFDRANKPAEQPIVPKTPVQKAASPESFVPAKPAAPSMPSTPAAPPAPAASAAPTTPNTPAALTAPSTPSTPAAPINPIAAAGKKQTQQDLCVVLEQLPVPIMVYRDNDLLFASGDFLQLTQYASVQELNQRGGLEALFGGDETRENNIENFDKNAPPKPDQMQLTLKNAERVNVNARLQRVDWDKGSALLMAFTSIQASKPNNEAPDNKNDNKPPVDESAKQALLENKPPIPVKSGLELDDESQFMTRVSHEIRAPLNTIIGFSDLIMDERFGPLKNDKYREYMRDIRRSGSDMLDIINDYLDLSKIKSGDIHLVEELVSINQLIAETVEIVQPQANGDQIIVRTSLSKSVPSIKIDATTTRQVILNLITNAIKTTPTGGQIIISSLLDASGEVIVRIRDSGNGMDEQMLDYVMEPMKPKASMELVPKPMDFNDNRFDSHHAGLELSLTKALVEAAGAKFEIFSELKKGTVVELTFPKSQVLQDAN